MNTAGETMREGHVRLLEEMGIDVWRRRLPGGSAVAAGAGDTTADTSADRAAAAGAAEQRAGRQMAGTAGRSRRTRQRSVVEPRDAGSERPTGSEAVPFKALCVTGRGAVLLVEPAEPRVARRFCRDLIAAVTGEWQTGCTELVFEWPQQGVDRDEASMARALRAFVDGQASDHDGSVLLMDSKVAERLGEVPGFEVLPHIDRLMTDGALKRAVWSRIHGRRSG